MKFVITHPDRGIYLGNFLGLGFWTLLDTVGQIEATTFPDIAAATAHISTWDENSDPNTYAFVAVDCETDGATIPELVKAGLGDRLGDMLDNLAWGTSV